MTEYKKILFDRAGEITTITFNRPEAHNALDREMSDELADAVRRVKNDRECRFLVFRGAGETFCAGDDIKDFLTWTDDDPYWQARQYQETAQMIEDLTPITIAAVDGVCTGGGLELTLTCDFVVATDRSRWGMPEIDWEITPGWGGVTRLARFAGRRKTKEWNMIGQLFDAATAERHDLINRVVSADDLDTEVNALVEVLSQKNPITLRRTKFALNKGADLPLSGAMAFEIPVQPFASKPGRFATDGMEDFAQPEARARRRVISKSFWQD
ncbi:MAG: 3-hydroxypropionyl-coenzyme dehydratase [Pseudonocardiales bacterium]|nr:3-hydroxypropionyl-coenzyme dehydratase [Pseudonocardiales bacterium]MDT7620882.1 3-hydroxypropionyl-coenzyme dehydratase [Pseudonocardiales bacterium]